MRQSKKVKCSNMCRKMQVQDAEGNITAKLGPGIVAIKFGVQQWWVRFDIHCSNLSGKGQV
jgi:hypothetical protein